MVDRWVADSTLSASYPIYTRANVGEVFPDPVTPLTFDSGICGWPSSAGATRGCAMGAFEPDEFDPTTSTSSSAWSAATATSTPRSSGSSASGPRGCRWQVMDEQFFGAQPGIPPYEEQPGRRPARPDRADRRHLRLGALRRAAVRPARAHRGPCAPPSGAGRAPRPHDAHRPGAGRPLRRADRPPFRNLFAHHLFATYMATVPVGIIQAVRRGRRPSRRS